MKRKSESEKQIRKVLYANIRGYNRHLPMEVLVKMNLMALLRNCHPVDRRDFARKMNALGLLSNTQVTQLDAPYVQKRSRDELYKDA